MCEPVLYTLVTVIFLLLLVSCPYINSKQQQLLPASLPVVQNMTPNTARNSSWRRFIRLMCVRPPRSVVFIFVSIALLNFVHVITCLLIWNLKNKQTDAFATVMNLKFHLFASSRKAPSFGQSSKKCSAMSGEKYIVYPANVLKNTRNQSMASFPGSHAM